MSKVILNIKDETKGEALLTLLRQMDFLEIGEPPRERRPAISGFLKAGGIWKKREITLSSIRRSAWRNDSL